MMNNLIKRWIGLSFCICLLLLFSENQVSAFQRFDIGAERLYYGVANSQYQLRLSRLSYDYDAEHNLTNYIFKAWGPNDINCANVRVTVDADGYVGSIFIDFNVNNNSSYSQDTFNRCLWACVAALGVSTEDQLWLSSHWSPTSTDNATSANFTEVTRYNGAIFRITMVYITSTEQLTGFISQI